MVFPDFAADTKPTIFVHHQPYNVNLSFQVKALVAAGGTGSVSGQHNQALQFVAGSEWLHDVTIETVVADVGSFGPQWRLGLTPKQKDGESQAQSRARSSLEVFHGSLNLSKKY